MANREKDYRKCEDNVNAKKDILILIDEYEENKSFGGFEVKYEAGRITFVKDWRGKKY